MIKAWPLPTKISETIKMLDFSMKKIEKYSTSNIDINFYEEHSFSLPINSFLNISKKLGINSGMNTMEFTQYNFSEVLESNIFLSKDIFFIRAAGEIFLPDSAQKIKTLVRSDINNNGITSLFPIFYTLANADNIDKFLSRESLFKDKLLEYKNKISGIPKLNSRLDEYGEYFDNLIFDSDNFVGNDFITILKSDNNDFIKSKMSVKIDENNYFIVSNIFYKSTAEEIMDFKPTFLSSLFLIEKLKKSVDYFIETFYNDFLIDSL